MASNLSETLIGAVVVATAVGFLVYAGQVAGVSAGDDSYELHAKFDSAQGLNIGGEVQLAGVRVGTITKLELDTTTYLAVTTFTVRSDIEIPEDSEAKVASEGLLGGNFLELTPGGSDYMLESGAEVEFTQGSVSLLNLLAKFASGSGSDE
ncbi:MAG TPA: outer membrane lipid asymmetry maintenance protein MlaD [Rhodobacteraceae bacterium]|nr:outer membrane lipid asymmetry maintenance protein MlaD [Paracoccaceae bacterium]